MSGETGLVRSESGRPQWVARVNRSAREGGKGRERWEAGRGMPTWNLPGPIWMVFISVWQLHFLVPGAD